MRAATLLLIGLMLGGCAVTDIGNDTTPMTSPQPQVAAPSQPAPQPGTAPGYIAPASAPATAVAPAPVPPTAAAPAPSSPPPAAAPPPSRRPVPAAARATTPPQAPPEPAAEPQEPMTHERASMLCWSKFEDGRKKLSLDQRADLVDKCVKATMRGEKVN